MRSALTHSLIGPMARRDARPDVAEWARSFTLGRLAGLTGAFGAAPFALVLPAESAAVIAPIVIAALAVAALGLLGARFCARPLHAAALSGAGYAGLIAGAGVGAGFAPAALLALIALSLDIIALPDTSLPRRVGAIAVGLIGAGCALAAAPAAPVSSAAPLLLAACLLPLAALTTLTLALATLRRRLDRRSADDAQTAGRDAGLLAAADVAVLIVDRGGHALESTARAASLLGARGPLIGRALIDRVLIADRPAFLTAASRAASDGAEAELTLRLAVEAGTPEAPAPARFGRFLLTFRNAGGARASIRIDDAAAEAETGPMAAPRPDLFGLLSHEVRTPMNAILGFSEILASPALAPSEPAKVAEYAAIINRSAKDAFAVTRTVVDLLRLDSGECAAPSEETEPEAMLRAAAAALTSREPDEALAILFEGSWGREETMDADPRALRMLLGALLEGLYTAAGAPARLTCGLNYDNGRRCIDIRARAMAPPANAAVRHAAFLGVLEVLAARLSLRVGATVRFSRRADEEHHVRIVFNAGVVDRIPARAVTPFAPSHGPTPLRKIA